MKHISLIIILLLMLLSPVILTRIANWFMVSSGKIKDKRKCKKRTVATITKIEDGGRINRDTGRGYETIAHYEFMVGGKKYYGIDEIFSLPINPQTVTVFYDPADPDNNCTRFGKGQQSGSNTIIGILVVIGVIAVILVAVLGPMVLLGARYR